jgi:23S rRNA (adenine2503-C2)-methyltransferase
MGCKFCASTLDGLTRNLTAGEMLAEVYAMRREAKSRIDSLVLMGCGEPLDNYEEVMTFLRRLSDPEGYGLSLRNVTLSTCGLVPQIYRLAEEGLPITLAISLHAPDDELRRVTMPVANRYSIEEILQACAVYFEKTGRRITFEYALVKGLNDGKEQALTLAKRLTSLKLSGKTVPCHVNLIPVNPVKERGLLRTEKQEVFRFQELLKKNGVNATIRREMGQDIDGACGQLRQNRKSLLTNCNNCVTE